MAGPISICKSLETEISFIWSNKLKTKVWSTFDITKNMFNSCPVLWTRSGHKLIKDSHCWWYVWSCRIEAYVSDPIAAWYLCMPTRSWSSLTYHTSSLVPWGWSQVYSHTFQTIEEHSQGRLSDWLTELWLHCHAWLTLKNKPSR